MRRPLVAGNWKMNGSCEQNAALVDGLTSGDRGQQAEMAVFPPSVYVANVAEMLADSGIAWGLQNCAEQEKGAFTGEASAVMAKDLGCKYVLVGHSERRTLFGETDEVVATKVQRLVEQGIVPVLCVGETLEEREAGTTIERVGAQVKAVLDQFDPAGEIVIAYEPVWAIGTGLTATPEQAQEVHAAIRDMLVGYSADLAAKTRILYGGSVNAGTAAELFAKEDIDGGLVGGASLKAEEFLKISRAAG
ncbi:triose-phosphate isomerase [Endozoicomonadaceae bacterium StTr2]